MFDKLSTVESRYEARMARVGAARETARIWVVGPLPEAGIFQ